MTYMILTLFYGVCIAMEWGAEFGRMAFIHIWYITPLFKVLEINCGCLKKLYGLCVHCCLDPCCEAAVSSSMRSRNEWRNQINHFCFAGLPSAFLSSHCPSSALPPACHQCGSFRFSTVLLLAFSGRAQLTVRRMPVHPLLSVFPSLSSSLVRSSGGSCA